MSLCLFSSFIKLSFDEFFQIEMISQKIQDGVFVLDEAALMKTIFDAAQSLY